MEAQWIADRTMLRTLLRTHPTWTMHDFADAVGRSRSWTKKWVKRLRAASPDDTTVLHSRSRARKQPPPRLSTRVVERILEIRDQPPENLHRTPGPKAILYYLHHSQPADALPERLPRSTRTIWRILRQHGRIATPAQRQRKQLERPAPLTVWQLDFKDASTVPADPDGKQQHVVDVLNTRLSPHAVTSQQRNPAPVAPSVYDMGNDQQLRPASTLELSGPFNTLVPPHA